MVKRLVESGLEHARRKRNSQVVEKMKAVVVNNGGEDKVRATKQKERHIVSWSQEEDDILREQIRVHGTENWTIIASKFKDKTTRQCRRRWFTYLNSDFKKGGWSPEEDMLLCEAQKIFGNRWTEIAKVVSGRTDNAVKNRFTTLCKKRAKPEALAQENSKSSSYINLNNKRVIFPNRLNADGGSESAAALKMTRTTYTSSTIENLLGHPFQVLAQRLHSRIVNLPTEEKNNTIKEAPPTSESVNNDSEQTFLKKGDPKVVALMRQAELLSSLAVKVNTENTDHSLENAWTVLQDYLKQNEETGLPRIRNSDAGFRLEKLKEIMGDPKSSNDGSGSSWRDGDVYDSSPASSEYSTGSTLLSNGPRDNTDKSEAEICVLNQGNEHDLQSDHLDDDQHFLAEENGICRMASENEGDNRASSEHTNMEFSSPVHVTPLFRAFAAAIPSPKFSESEKHFLMKTLGIESASPASPLTNPAQPPACKRSLLHCL